jgi:hypothetical protein
VRPGGPEPSGFRAPSVAYGRDWGDNTTSIDELLYRPIVGLCYRF